MSTVNLPGVFRHAAESSARQDPLKRSSRYEWSELITDLQEAHRGDVELHWWLFNVSEAPLKDPTLRRLVVGLADADCEIYQEDTRRLSERMDALDAMLKAVMSNLEEAGQCSSRCTSTAARVKKFLSAMKTSSEVDAPRPHAPKGPFQSSQELPMAIVKGVLTQRLMLRKLLLAGQKIVKRAEAAIEAANSKLVDFADACQAVASAPDCVLARKAARIMHNNELYTAVTKEAAQIVYNSG